MRLHAVCIWLKSEPTEAQGLVYGDASYIPSVRYTTADPARDLRALAATKVLQYISSYVDLATALWTSTSTLRDTGTYRVTLVKYYYECSPSVTLNLDRGVENQYIKDCKHSQIKDYTYEVNKFLRPITVSL